MPTPSPTQLGLIDRLRAQHRTILRNLERLEGIGVALEQGGMISATELDRLRTFFRHFVQVEHESIEESLLFPALAARCTRGEIDTLARLEAEHLWEGALLQDFDLASPRLTAQLIRTFAPLVRLHIEREEQQVFPLAELRIPREELQFLGRTCDAILGAASPVSGERADARECERDPWCLDRDWQGGTVHEHPSDVAKD